MSAESGIIRTRRDKNNPYQLMKIDPLQDKRLSWEARGLLAFLLSKPDDWQVRVENLLQESPRCGRDKLQRILAELEEHSYIVRTVQRGPGGRFVWSSTVYETPQPLEDQPESAPRKARKPRKGRTPKHDESPKPDFPVMVQNTLDSTVTGFTVDGSTVDGKPGYITNTESTKEKKKDHGATAPKSRATRQPDPNQQHPACEMFQRFFDRRPNREQAAAIATTITDLDRWNETLLAWKMHGWKPTNVPGMINRYQKPNEESDNGRSQRPQNQHGRSGVTPRSNRTGLADDFGLEGLE